MLLLCLALYWYTFEKKKITLSAEFGPLERTQTELVTSELLWKLINLHIYIYCTYTHTVYIHTHAYTLGTYVSQKATTLAVPTNNRMSRHTLHK